MRVKICGITNLADARAAADAGADVLGFNFYAESRRYIPPEAAAEIVAQLPRGVCAVGVFVNVSRPCIEEVAEHVGLTAVQFHGDESPELCRAWGLKTIKACRIRDAHSAVQAHAYDVDFILADAYVEGHFGGTGACVAPEMLGGFDRNRLILAGGLTVDNVGELVRTVRPFGVDVASGVESAPGKKDWELMRRFIANAHAA